MNVESHQYTAEGTIEQVGELASGLHRHQRGRLYARLLLVVIAVPFVVWIALLLIS